MTTCSLFLSGRVVWAGDEKTTKRDRPMKTVLVATDDQEGDDALPALMVTVIGDESLHLDKGSWLSAEGTPELEVVEKDGQPTIRWRMLARRVMLSGADHAARRRAKAAEKGQETKAKNAEAKHQESMNVDGTGNQASATGGPAGPEPPPFDDPIGF